MTLKGWLLAGGMGLAISTPAFAQDGATKTGSEVEEVVIYGHAEKETGSAIGLELTPRETPQSITAITAQQMQDQALSNVSDVLAFSTGISAKAVDRGRNTLSARGFDITNFQIDGAPFQNGNIGFDETSTALYERIEIVRGATGLLNGTGQPSASINMIRKHANSTVRNGEVSLEVGTWDRFAGTVDFSTPLNSEGTVRGRLVAEAYTQDAFVDLEETKGYVLYGVVDADLGERTRLSVGGAYQKDERAGVMWGQLAYWFTDGSRTDWDRSTTTGTDWNQWDTTNTTAFARLDHELESGWKLRGDVGYHHQVENSKLLWTDGLPDSVTGEGIEGYGYWYDARPEQWNLSFMAQGPFNLFGREHELVAGLTYNRAENGWTNRDPTPSSAPVGNFFDWDGSYPEPSWGPRYDMSGLGVTKQFAGYAAARLNILDNFKVIVGGRVDNWRRNEEAARYTPEAYTVKYDNIFTPYAGAIFDFNESISAYVSYTSIFWPDWYYKDRNGDFLDPIEGNAYEAGLKGDFLDGLLFASLAVFRTEQDNLAVPDPGYLVPGTIDQAYRPAKGTVAEGYEIEVSGKLTAAWDVNLGWTDYSAKDQEGVNVLAQHPRRMLKIATVYDLGDVIAGLRIGGAARWESQPPMEAINPGSGLSERIGQPSYTIVSVMAEYEVTKNVSAQLNINNLFDETYFSNNNWFPGFVYGEPRNARFTLRYSF